MSTVTTDKEAQTFVAANVQSLLKKQGRTTYWLMKETHELPNRIYPVVRGDAMATAGLLSRIAEALGVTADFLLKKPSKKILEKFFPEYPLSA